MKTAVIVIDVQNAILAGEAPLDRRQAMDAALDATALRLRQIQDRARAAGVPVIVVQHDDMPGSPLAVGTPGWELRPEIAPQPGDVLVSKRACDSFFDTDLDQRLCERGIRHLVIGGCMTQFCVDTTARRAVSLGYDVTLIGDGHMTADMGALTFDQIIAHHNATLDGFDAGEHRVAVRPGAIIGF